MNKQTPWSVNQNKVAKPNIDKTFATLHGYIANSFNGGHNKTIAYKQVMAGEKIQQYNIQLFMQMLTPLTPTYQHLKCKIRTYFVPNSRVWKNAENFTAQKTNTTDTTIKEIPNLANKQIPFIETKQGNYLPLQHTQIWRDSFISSYISRIGHPYIYFVTNLHNQRYTPLPALSVLGIRGRVAIYNDFERDKNYDERVMEYDTDTVSDVEWKSYLPLMPDKHDYYTMRSKRDDSYYTNYRTSLQEDFEMFPQRQQMGYDDPGSALITWSAWEAKIAQARDSAEFGQMNDWDIIAKIRGSKKLTEGKVQLIGENTFNLNYSAITQNAYNTNENINPQFQVMGKQGAYSYTEINVPVLAGFQAAEEGYIHVIATVTADSVFESAFDRLELNTKAIDMYTPDKKEDKYDVLLQSEIGNIETTTLDYNKIIGFKRRFSEYFKLPNNIGGDMSTCGYMNIYTVKDTSGNPMKYVVDEEESEILSNNTYQFFEVSNQRTAETSYDSEDGEENLISFLKIWKDYTDILINKNQAIKNKLLNTYNANSQNSNMYIDGQNQIFYVGYCICNTDLPIDKDIKDNYSQWAEH